MFRRQWIMRELARAWRFGFIGVINTANYTVLFLVLLHATPAPYWVASPVAFTIAAAIAYRLNHRFTFRAAVHSRALFVQFFVVQGLGAIVNVLALAFGVETLGWSPTLAQFVVLPPVVATTFVLQRLVVFRDHIDARDHADSRPG